MTKIPIITIDGTSASGKGVLSRLLANRLGFNHFDSGISYRLLGWYSLNLQTDEKHLESISKNMPFTFDKDLIYFCGKYKLSTKKPIEISKQIRSEEVAKKSSKIAQNEIIRHNLLSFQHKQVKAPGLVADGRDMGSVVFANADIKFYLDASLNIRTERRLKELRLGGLDVNFKKIRAEIQTRDENDKKRKVSPLIVPKNAIKIDSSQLKINEVLDFCYKKIVDLCII